MSPPVAPATPSRPVDALSLRRIRHRLQAAPTAPWLHLEVARRMAERLPIVKLQPTRVLDWWAAIGGGQEQLARTYPKAELWEVEDGDGPARERAAASASWWSPRRWRGTRGHRLLEPAVEAGSAQLVWSNMGMHLQPDPEAVMARWHRALAVDGFLMFSTLGPGSLPELRGLYRALGWPAPHAPFVDMHDLGDMLVHVGFADPVMDQELITLHWSDGAAMLAELRTIGGNADLGRHAGLRTPRWRDRLQAALREPGASRDGRPQLTFEVVYGHAMRVAPRPAVAERTTIALDDMRAMMASRRRR